MTIVYRTTGPHGAGKGSKLTKEELDGNFYDLALRVSALEEASDGEDPIDSIDVTGGQMTITSRDGTVFGPFTLPVAIFHPRDEYEPGSDYAFMDLFTVSSGDDAGMYLVVVSHEAPSAFDPSYSIGGDNVYQLVAPSIQGPPGADGEQGEQGEQGEPGEPGQNFNVDAVGTFAERDEFDAENEGFRYLSTDGDGSTDGTSAVIFIRMGSTEGEWSDPIPFQGPPGEDATPRTLKTVTDATYTLIAGDEDKYLRFTNAAGCDVTVPDDVFSVNDQIPMRATLGQISLVGPATPRYPADFEPNSRAPMSSIHLFFVAADEYDLTGDLEVSA